MFDPAALLQIPVGTGAKPQLAHRNNNPGNLAFAGQDSAVKGDKGFAKFPSPDAGALALLRQIKKDQGRGLTVGEFVTKYAPPHENDTARYTKLLRSALKVPATAKLADADPMAVARFVAKHESGTDLSQFALPSDLPAMGKNPAPVRADATNQPTAPLPDPDQGMGLFHPLNTIKAAWDSVGTDHNKGNYLGKASREAYLKARRASGAASILAPQGPPPDRLPPAMTIGPLSPDAGQIDPSLLDKLRSLLPRS